MPVDPAQVQRAANALLQHMRKSKDELTKSSTKQSLIDEGDDSAGGAGEPIWLILTTKKHVVDKKRLKPARIPIPHSLHPTTTSAISPTRICLITADPQRAYKDLVASPAFPAHLRNAVSRVISISKLKAKHSAFEAKRQLAAQHDVFLADDRVVTLLPAILGKTFYKGGEKRPVPIELAGDRKGREKVERDSLGAKKRPPRTADGKVQGPKNVGTPRGVANEIERALGAALVHLSPSVTTAVRVAHAGMEADMVRANVEAVVQGLVERFVPQKWKGVRAIHIKGPNSAALPVWMAEELWVEEGDVLDEKWAPSEEQVKKIEEKKAERASKRKLIAAEREQQRAKRKAMDDEEGGVQEVAASPPAAKKRKVHKA